MAKGVLTDIEDYRQMSLDLLRDYPEAEELPISIWDLLIRATLATAEHHARVMPEQRILLFELAGRLKGVLEPLWVERETGDDYSDPRFGTIISPVALLYVQRLQEQVRQALPETYIRWSDEDSVTIAFETAWIQRRTTISGFQLSAALAWSEGNPLGIAGNRHVARVVNIAYYLALRQPGVPILVPVTETLANGMGVTKVTLATAIRSAVSRGFLTVENNYYSVSQKISRKFTFNFDHPDLASLKELP